MRAEDVGDHDVLRPPATAVGLDAARVEQVLAGDEYADAVQADIAPGPGATAPPACRSSWSTRGTASPAPSRPRSSSQVLERAWADSRPRSRWPTGATPAARRLRGLTQPPRRARAVCDAGRRAVRVPRADEYPCKVRRA